MGMIDRILDALLGNGNVIKETAEVFLVNAEADAGRVATVQGQALGQFGQEFRHLKRGLFDRVMDGVKRLPRPALALGTIGLFVSAMVDPVWFAVRMTGSTLVPEPPVVAVGGDRQFLFWRMASSQRPSVAKYQPATK